jgi:hypothetical protein
LPAGLPLQRLILCARSQLHSPVQQKKFYSSTTTLLLTIIAIAIEPPCTSSNSKRKLERAFSAVRSLVNSADMPKAKSSCTCKDMSERVKIAPISREWTAIWWLSLNSQLMGSMRYLEDLICAVCIQKFIEPELKRFDIGSIPDPINNFQIFHFVINISIEVFDATSFLNTNGWRLTTSL